jgi:hypothetical protein
MLSLMFQEKNSTVMEKTMVRLDAMNSEELALAPLWNGEAVEHLPFLLFGDDGEDDDDVDEEDDFDDMEDDFDDDFEDDDFDDDDDDDDFEDGDDDYDYEDGVDYDDFDE